MRTQLGSPWQTLRQASGETRPANILILDLQALEPLKLLGFRAPSVHLVTLSVSVEEVESQSSSHPQELSLKAKNEEKKTGWDEARTQNTSK